MKLSEYINTVHDLGTTVIKAKEAAESDPTEDNLTKLNEAINQLERFRKDNYQTHKMYLDRLTRNSK